MRVHMDIVPIYHLCHEHSVTRMESMDMDKEESNENAVNDDIGKTGHMPRHMRPMYDTDGGLVPVDALRDAISHAVRNGSVSRRSINSDTLQGYDLKVRIGGKACVMRLDMALALLKMTGDVSTDSYGRRITGGYVTGTGKKRRAVRLTYLPYCPHARTERERLHDACIDYAIPQSHGGETRLCNMQVMRAGMRARKRDVPMPVSSDDVDSARRVINELLVGACRGLKDGSKKQNDVMGMCFREMEACDRMAERD